MICKDLALCAPIYLTTDDTQHSHVYSLNGNFLLAEGGYVAWGEPTDARSLVEVGMEQKHTLELTDDEFQLVRKYLMKHAEIVKYLSLGQFPLRLQGREMREQKKTFKKMVRCIFKFLNAGLIVKDICGSARNTLSLGRGWHIHLLPLMGCRSKGWFSHL
jgi:hypothetical protein